MVGDNVGLKEGDVDGAFEGDVVGLTEGEDVVGDNVGLSVGTKHSSVSYVPYSLHSLALTLLYWVSMLGTAPIALSTTMQ